MIFHQMYLLLKRGRAYSHRFIRGNGMNETEHMLCAYVLTHEYCSQEEVSAALDMDKTTAAKALQVLEKKRFLRRIPDERDRRRNLLSLTPEGHQCTHQVLDIIRSWQTRLLNTLSKEEIAQLEHICQKLLIAAEEASNEAITGGNQNAACSENQPE